MTDTIARSVIDAAKESEMSRDVMAIIQARLLLRIYVVEYWPSRFL